VLQFAFQLDSHVLVYTYVTVYIYMLSSDMRKIPLAPDLQERNYGVNQGGCELRFIAGRSRNNFFLILPQNLC
jgi:hypothetical protein